MRKYDIGSLAGGMRAERFSTPEKAPSSKRQAVFVAACVLREGRIRPKQPLTGARPLSQTTDTER
ncbi:MAG: hypothetical protein IH820_09280 [Bacteroidetes bacterium]|nr:hypothetical protein [Bacteroidota bacterium]